MAIGKRLKRASLFFAIALLVYLLAVIAVAISTYLYSQKLNLLSFDQALIKTAGLANNLLYRESPSLLVGDGELTASDDYRIALALQRMADFQNVTFIYSLVESDSGILFTSSNPLQEELASAQYEPVYRTPYADAPDAAKDAFDLGQMQFSEYRDQWGHFRSIFFPVVEGESVAYVIGVDISIEQLRTAALKSAILACALGLFLGVIIFPLIFLCMQVIQSHYQSHIFALQMHPITSLPNKRKMQSELERASSPKLLVIKIENFDYIINAKGVIETDRLLLKLAYILRDIELASMAYCSLYHVEENQFALLTEKDFSHKQERELVNRVHRALVTNKVRTKDGAVFPLVVRMAAVKDQVNPYQLANMALMHSSYIGKSFILCTSSLKLPHYFQDYIYCFNVLREALEQDRVKVLYQPIVDVVSQRTVKYEALVRLYDHHGKILLSPDEFMPVAYQSRLCHKLTRVVLDRVIEVLGQVDEVVSINLSVKDLFDESTRNYIIQQVRGKRVGERLEIELLEQQVIANYSLAAAYIRQLKSCVNGFGMDDLGKLYSNLDRLLCLPLDFVKIDGAVVQSLDGGSESEAIVEGIVEYASQRGILVVAEYCSTEALCQKVTSMGVDLMQGYYLGAPKEMEIA